MIARRIESIAQMTEEAQSAAGSVRDVAHDVKHYSDQLKQLMDNFKIS
jgi:methyl-accepting chemotaxis protein